MMRPVLPGSGETRLQPLRSLDSPARDEIAAWDLLRSVDTEVALSELSAARILNRLNAGDIDRAATRAGWSLRRRPPSACLACRSRWRRCWWAYRVASRARGGRCPSARACGENGAGQSCAAAPPDRSPLQEGLVPGIEPAPAATSPAPLVALPEAAPRQAPVLASAQRPLRRPRERAGEEVPISSQPEVEVSDTGRPGAVRRSRPHGRPGDARALPLPPPRGFAEARHDRRRGAGESRIGPRARGPWAARRNGRPGLPRNPARLGAQALAR